MHEFAGASQAIIHSALKLEKLSDPQLLEIIIKIFNTRFTDCLKKQHGLHPIAIFFKYLNI
jgi:hypothetical protein